MSNAIQAEHCFLLSAERVQVFQDSGVEETERNIKNYIRNILPNGNLSDLANETGIDIGLIIVFANYAKSFKQLKAIVSNNLFLTSLWGVHVIPGIKDIIENDIKDFSLEKIGEVQAQWEIREEIARGEAQKKRETENKKREEVNNERYSLLCDYFGIEDTQEGRRILWANEITQSTLADEIIEYCKENDITELGENGWSFYTGAAFLNWYADKEDLPRSYSPDEIAAYTGVDHLRSLYL